MLVLDQQAKTSKLERIADFGMITGSVGDIIPVIVGGYAAYRHGYEQARAQKPNEGEKYWEARGTLAFEMMTDNAQQAGNIKDQSAYAKGGSLARVLTMYATSPTQYMNNTTTAIVDAMAKRPGSRKKLAKMLFINHVVLPSMFYWVSWATANMVKGEDDQEEIEDALNGWYMSMMLGPYSGAFIFGKGLSQLASGYSYKLPVLAGAETAMRAGHKTHRMLTGDEDITPADVIEVVDLVADTASYVHGKGLGKTYQITKNAAKSIGFDKADRERILMGETEGLVHDLGKKWSKAKKDHPEVTKGDKAHLPARYQQIAEDYSEVKAKHPHAWAEVSASLKKKGKLPAGVRVLIR